MASIQRIRSMTSLGIFADVRSAAPPPDFQRYNLIYGYNGSGKTTLSRVLSSFENGAKDGRLPEASQFEIELADGIRLAEVTNIGGLQGQIAVFNADYVAANLQWSEGRASPIYYIGADQADAADRIRQLEAQLPERRLELQAADEAVKAADKLLATQKREGAKLVASHLHLGTRKYEANHLAAAYEAEKHLGAQKLTADQIKAFEDVLRLNEPVPKVVPSTYPLSETASAIEQATKLAETSIGMVMLAEIDAHPEMLQWVKVGHDYHSKHHLRTCLFCTGPLTEERSKLLSEALDDRVSRFISAAETARDNLKEVSRTLQAFWNDTPPAAAISAVLQGEYQTLLDGGRRAVRQTQMAINSALVAIEAKLAAPTRNVPRGADEASAALQALSQIQNALVDVIGRHNDAFDAFATQQTAARGSIEAHYLGEGAEEYFRVVDEHAQRTREAGAAKVRHDDIAGQLLALRQQVREHGAAAGKVNALIKSYLGHSELQVTAVEEGYELWRHGELMRSHPSEGEKTAIALCYFLSSLESEGRNIGNMIVVIDDPISSLDTGALNFCCSLMKSRLSAAAQLFVLTHNHNCMNEFKKAWRAKSQDTPPSAALLFLDVQRAENAPRRSTRIVPMPGHLRAYDSEYVFLYEKMLRFGEQGDASEYFHLMPNVLRRVMEIFLAFKVPGSSPLQDKLAAIRGGGFDLDPDRLTALERLSQVESHSDNIDDLIGFSSMTIEETKSAAASLKEMIEKADPFHAERMARLCRSRA